MHAFFTPGDLPSAPPAYRLLRFLGEGGMGQVYQALEVAADRLVALKFLSPWTAGNLPLAYFEREAALMATLSHPNVVAIFASGAWQGRPYLAMEYVPGPSLRDLLKEFLHEQL